MIIVSITSSEEKIVIRLKHKLDYVVEKNFLTTNYFRKRNIYVFVQLFLSITKLMTKEIFMSSRI